ncbi:MAG: 2-hydroxyglutaryl-CoA dehydratase, partial [Planctomycetota bacterium]|nr:2-hydroxyglutaryl-CoA dehydratase [Planctomycetota bacterium]
MHYLGIDIGSVALKSALLDSDASVVETCYIRTHGQPLETALSLLKKILSSYNDIAAIAVTGYGSQVLSRLLDVPFVNEIV